MPPSSRKKKATQKTTKPTVQTQTQQISDVAASPQPGALMPAGVSAKMPAEETVVTGLTTEVPPAILAEMPARRAVDEKPQEPVACRPNQQWSSLYEAIAGLAHRDARPPLPCQDAALSLHSPRPCVLVADGAGSSAVSELGAQTVVTGLARLIITMEKQISALLDTPEFVSNEQGRALGLLFVKHAKGLLDDLAAQHRRPQKDFRCTLLLSVQGKARLLWVKIGDGALVVERLHQCREQLIPDLQTLGDVGKGEFANQTTFIDDFLQLDDVQTGFYPSLYLTGFAAMSDGAADRLVANDGSRVSSQISGWLHELRLGKLKRRTLTRLFYSDAFTQGTTGDDACLALASSGLEDRSSAQ